jgi:hypothetical protein
MCGKTEAGYINSFVSEWAVIWIQCMQRWERSKTKPEGVEVDTESWPTFQNWKGKLEKRLKGDVVIQIRRNININRETQAQSFDIFL